ncbi:MAG: hypothetical protein HC802_06055 [Caldilineaceae bacterium]|nr:hypothetical protein [Caldilineaceae bacterium]
MNSTQVHKQHVDSSENDPYTGYAELYDPDVAEESALLRRRPTEKRKPKKAANQVVSELADETGGLEAGFQTTYTPARYEAEWLLSSLRSFYDLAFITDVMAQVKGGKEANVYRCAADPSVGVEWLAAKVYRPRKFRNLRNDKMYREGRKLLSIDGRPAKEHDLRTLRALEKGSAFAAQVSHTSWLMHEFKSLEQLYRAGAAVPKPVATSENALLMGYCGNASMAAPTLHEIGLEKEEAGYLFQEVLRNIELMLQHNLIHGDLSAYNILCWEGEITLIDFPQVVNSEENAHAHFLLKRDITRVCEYFASQGVVCDPASITATMWERYSAQHPLDIAADLSRFQEEDDEDL